MTPYHAADPTDPTIESVASEVVWLERALSWHSTAEVSLGDSLQRWLAPDIATLFRKVEASQPVRIYRLRDVLLDAWIMALFRNRRPIRETAYLAFQEECDFARQRPLEQQPTEADAHYIVCSVRARENYYHWMAQTLPAIDCGVRQRSHPNVRLALPRLLPWQAETLALLGLADVPRLTLGVREHYAFASAEFAEFLTGRLPGIVSQSAAASYARLRQAVPAAPDGGDAIYVARTDAAARVMTNEAALIAMLERHGVRAIVPGRLPVRHQLAMFRRARLVIGAHGAGLANIVGCEPGAHLYELLPAHTPNYCFNRLAQTCGLHYWGDAFPSNAPDATWQVDLDLVARRLHAIRVRMAAGTTAIPRGGS